MRWLGQTSSTASNTSNRKRARFLILPPYSSVLRLVISCRNCLRKAASDPRTTAGNENSVSRENHGLFPFAKQKPAPGFASLGAPRSNAQMEMPAQPFPTEIGLDIGVETPSAGRDCSPTIGHPFGGW
jgi:hypothetical protein